MKYMHSSLKLLSLCLVFLFAVACSDSKTSNTEGTTTEESSQTTESGSNTIRVGSVVDGYLKLKDALVASNAEDAKKYATGMMEVVNAVEQPEVQQAIKEIAAAEDIEAQRVAFEEVSIHLYNDLKASGEVEQTLYKQYCPMAFDDKGAFWLSAQEEIRNPYFGDRMLKCGRVEEELPISN